MIIKIYFLILIFFFIGGVSFWIINKKRNRIQARNNWLKYITYFIIIQLLFLSIIVRPVFFRYLSLVILAAGFWELTNLWRRSGWSKPLLFTLSLITYTLFAISFYYFGWLAKEILLFTFLITAGFDAFSQISGQLLGRHKLFPLISPSKTIEGLVGGALISLGIAFIIRSLINQPWPQMLVITAGIILFAFAGDVSSSWYKRQYGVKDFSDTIPGHGGFLDRFDSLIAAGSFISLYWIINN